jgi:hypothetical protein
MPQYPGILGQDHVELVECVYQRLQEARSIAAVQGYSHLLRGYAISTQ